jgi:hypothetical protein
LIPKLRQTPWIQTCQKPATKNTPEVKKTEPELSNTNKEKLDKDIHPEKSTVDKTDAPKDKQVANGEKPPKSEILKDNPNLKDKELDNFKKYEDEVDPSTKKKMEEDADADVKKGKDHDSKAKALMMARVIVASNDKIDTPIPALMLELAPLKAMKGVDGFDKEPLGPPGEFRIVMFGSKYTVDENYKPENKNNGNNELNSKELQNLISTEEDAQFQVEAMKNTIQSGNNEDLADLWSQPIIITSYEGKKYILNGHNRLKALSELNLGLPKEAILKKLSTGDATILYKDKMEYIMKGEFNLKISE